MQWEQLTAADFERAAERTGVCILAAGVMEKHGGHLPLGTDYLNAHRIACLAAEKEPAVVFPPFYFGQIYEAMCFPGTIVIRPELLTDLVTGVLDEIGRNGFRKIVIFNGHGGNTHFLHFLAQCALWKEKAYSVYLMREWLTPERKERWARTCETTEHGHACECETSISLANHPELVKMKRVPKRGAKALGRMKRLPAVFTGVRWYSNYPEHYAGDARTASEEKGRILRDLIVDSLAEYVAAVKADRVVPGLQQEFFEWVKGVGGGSGKGRRAKTGGGGG